MLKPLVFVLVFFATIAIADDTVEATDKAQQEIKQLIQAVETSNCLFYRNGSENTASKAASHLRLKLNRGAKYAKTAEDFINNLATKSSWTNKPYYIKCGSEAKVTSKLWFLNTLEEIRQAPQ